MRDRLIELLLNSDPLHERDMDDDLVDGEIEAIADHLLANGVIVPPCKIGDEVYCIMAKGGLSGGLVFTGRIIKRKVDKLIYDGKCWEMMSDRVYPDYKDGNGLIYAYFDDLVFVSEEEANNRLKKILAVGDRMMKGGAE